MKYSETKRENDVSLIDKLLAHIYYWQDFFLMLKNLSRTYHDSFYLLRQALNQKYPIKAILKTGTVVSLRTFSALHLIANIPKDQKVHYLDDSVTIEQEERKIKIFGGLDNGDVVNIFFKRDYVHLPVKNRFVVDIGANIGDTTVFFATEGAKKIISIEPFPNNYELARKNVEANKLSDRAELLLAGCSNRTGFITINPNSGGNIESRLENTEKGIQIPLVTLDQIINRFQIPLGSVLKIDCEGCEYDVILGSSKETLQRFEHIQIEYHHGYRTLAAWLKKCGFNVSVRKPHATDVIHTIVADLRSSKSKHGKRHQIGYAGFLFATKNVTES